MGFDMSDAILDEFDYGFNAVHCAAEIQRELRAVNLGQPEGRKIQFRMGINHGAGPQRCW